MAKITDYSVTVHHSRGKCLLLNVRTQRDWRSMAGWVATLELRMAEYLKYVAKSLWLSSPQSFPSSSLHNVQFWWWYMISWYSRILNSVSVVTFMFSTLCVCWLVSVFSLSFFPFFGGFPCSRLSM